MSENSAKTVENSSRRYDTKKTTINDYDVAFIANDGTRTMMTMAPIVA
jgi:hypothetical protein